MAEIYNDYVNIPFDMKLNAEKHDAFFERVRQKYPNLAPGDFRIVAMDPELHAELFRLSDLVENGRPRIKQVLALYWGDIPGVKISFIRK